MPCACALSNRDQGRCGLGAGGAQEGIAQAGERLSLDEHARLQAGNQRLAQAH